jgi:hypothetical protein
MEEAIFQGKFPRHITPLDIKRWHLASFPKLANPENQIVMEEAINAVYTMFHGCQELFDMSERQVYYDKTTLIFRLLACWYIADQYPLLVAGVPTMGALPLKAKSIGNVKLMFQDNFTKGQNSEYQDLLSALKSNGWGFKAYTMIRSSAKRVMLLSTNRV